MAEKEYIEREALQNKAFGENHPTFYDGQDIADWYEKCINETPAADVSPVRHGYWKRELMSSKIGLYGYICSNCNKLIFVGQEKYMTYCGNCGAKMDEKERDENA